MIRTLRTLAVGAAATGLVLAVTASPADAKTRTFTDKRGDAQSALDITTVKVTNKKRVVIVRATMPGFKKSKLGFVNVSIRTKAAGRPQFTAVKSRIGRKHWGPLTLGSVDGRVACKGDRVLLGKKAVTVRIPQSCLGANKKPIRVGVVLTTRDSSQQGTPPAGPGSTTDGAASVTGEFGLKFLPWVRYR